MLMKCLKANEIDIFTYCVTILHWQTLSLHSRPDLKSQLSGTHDSEYERYSEIFNKNELKNDIQKSDFFVYWNAPVYSILYQPLVTATNLENKIKF
jgi:hypothetical protein